MAAVDEEEMRRFTESLRNFADALDATGDPISEEIRVRNAAIAARKKEIQFQKELGDSIGALTKNIRSVTTDFRQGAGDFKVLNSAIDLATRAVTTLTDRIPVLGGLISGFAKATAEGTKYVIEEYNRVYTIFEQLSDVGVVREFENISQISKRTGLTFADINKVLSKNSAALAYFGNSVQSGRELYEKTAEESISVRQNFQKLGITASDFNDYQISYLNRLQQTGNLEGDLVEKTTNYVLQLDALSKLTGKSRSELQKDLDARMRETRYRAAIATMDSQKKDEIDALVTFLESKGAGPLAAAVKDMVAGAGAVTTDAAKTAMINMPELAGVVQRLIQGTINASDAFNGLIPSAQRTMKIFGGIGGLGGVIGDASMATKDLVGTANLANAQQVKDIEQMKKESKAVMDAQEGQNARLAEAKNALYATSVEIEQLGTKAFDASALIKAFGLAAKKVSEYLNDFFGKKNDASPTPSPPNAPNPEVDTGASAAPSPSSSPGAAPSRVAPRRPTPQQLESFVPQPVAAGPAPTLPRLPTVAGNRPNLQKAYSINDILQFQGGLTGNFNNFAGLDDSFRENFIKMAAEYYMQTGNPLKITSAARNIEEQIEIMKRNSNKWNLKNPLDSLHVQGLAIDVTPDQAQYLINRGLLNKFGFKSGAGFTPPDMNHIYAKNGGIYNGPGNGYSAVLPSGRSATLHANELIQPLHQNSILQKLATTPQTEIRPATSSENASIEDLTSTLSNKMDAMVKFLSDIKSIQSKLLTKTYA